MNQTKNRLVQPLCILIIAILFIALFAMPVTDGDTFFHIKLGEWITQNGLPTKDMFSIHDNLNYSAYAFGFEIIVYWVYALFGFSGIVIFKYFMMILMAILISFFLYKLDTPIIKAVVFGFLSIVSMKVFTQVRPQLVSYVIIIIQLYIANKWVKNKDSKIIWFTPLTMLAISLLHSGVFFFHIGILAIFGIDILFENFRINNLFKDKHFYTYLIVGLLSIVTIAFNPYFPGIVFYAFNTVGDDTMMQVSEWHATPLIAIMIFIILLVFIFKYLNVKKSPIGNYICLGLCFILTALHYRFFPYAVIVLAFFVPYMNPIKISEQNKASAKALLNRCIKTEYDIKFALGAFLIFAIIYTSIGFASDKRNYSFVISEERYPVKIVEYIKENNITGRMYNSYNDGAFLLFNDIPVFIDSRCDPYSKSFNNVDILDDEFKFAIDHSPESTIFTMAEKYSLQYGIISTQAPIYQWVLQEIDKYTVLYEDENWKFIEFT